VVTAKVSGHAITLRSSPTVFDVWFNLDPHLIWQATKRELKRGNAFGFVSHKGLLHLAAPMLLAITYNIATVAGER
jgi:hypothetical protein